MKKNEAIEKAKKKGYKAILWDLDDSIIRTANIIIKYKDLYVKEVCQRTKLDYKEVTTKLAEFNDKGFEVKSVLPERWDWVAERMVEVFGYKDVFVGSLPIIKKIYASSPRMVRGAKNVLEEMSRSEIKMGMVTHASSEWTEIKIKRIKHIFHHVRVVDPSIYKSKADWLEAAKALEVEPQECIAIGDSLRNDIAPAGELGMAGILLPSVWHVYAQGVMPKKAVSVKQVSKIFEGIEKLLEIEV